MNQEPNSNSGEADFPADDRFLSFVFLSYDLERTATEGMEGDAAQMRDAVIELRAIRARFDQQLSELEQVIAEFSALDDLF